MSLPLVLRHVDIETLAFFSGLFVLIGGLEKTGFMRLLADDLGAYANGSPTIFLLSLHWFSGIASALIDNVPLTQAMTYVLHDIARLPAAPAVAIMTWALALGVNIGGNMTPIGASANVVSYAYLEKHHGKVGWSTWMRIAIPPTVISMLIASLLNCHRCRFVKTAKR